MTSRGVKSESSELSRGDSAVPSISLALLATALGGGALLGAAVAGATANRSQPDDVISGEISIDLLKKVELLKEGLTRLGGGRPKFDRPPMPVRGPAIPRTP